jgi:hypothetical protein
VLASLRDPSSIVQIFAWRSIFFKVRSYNSIFLSLGESYPLRSI